MIQCNIINDMPQPQMADKIYGFARDEMTTRLLGFAYIWDDHIRGNTPGCCVGSTAHMYIESCYVSLLVRGIKTGESKNQVL